MRWTSIIQPAQHVGLDQRGTPFRMDQHHLDELTIAPVRMEDDRTIQRERFAKDAAWVGGHGAVSLETTRLLVNRRGR